MFSFGNSTHITQKVSIANPGVSRNGTFSQNVFHRKTILRKPFFLKKRVRETSFSPKNEFAPKLFVPSFPQTTHSHPSAFVFGFFTAC